MKIIDLLNKIANKEDLPKKIRFKDVEYIKKEDNFNDISYYESTTSKYDLLTKRINTTVVLNDEVELIEDEEIDIPNIEELDTHTFDSNIRTITVQNRNKINEIIKMFNQVIKMFNQEIKRTRKEKE